MTKPRNQSTTSAGYAVMPSGQFYGIFAVDRGKSQLVEGGFPSEAAAECRFRERFSGDARPRAVAVPMVHEVLIDY